MRKLKFAIAVAVLALTIGSDSQAPKEHVALPPEPVQVDKLNH